MREFETIATEKMPEKEDKVLSEFVKELDRLYDIIANRVSDLRSINDTLFGDEPVSEPKKYSEDFNGALLVLKDKLERISDKAEELMPEIKRLDRLV